MEGILLYYKSKVNIEPVYPYLGDDDEDAKIDDERRIENTIYCNDAHHHFLSYISNEPLV